MKIGIVTEPLVGNFGGVLQNYALQEVLRRMGHETVTLDYRPMLPLWRYLLYVGKNVLLYPVKKKAIKPYHRFMARSAGCNAFIHKHISLTKPMGRYRLPSGLEALVVGSDQVWRKDYNEHLEDMYLAFAQRFDGVKLAYAASFGVQNWDYSQEQTAMAERLIKEFTAVSVREASGVRLLRENLDCEARVMPDPTLLLDTSDYQRLCADVPRADVPFLFAYILDSTPQKESYIQTIARDKGLVVKYVTISSETDCSIERWLAMFRDASYIVTDSFHGTVFSILFRKPFRLFVNEERGADRFHTLFDELGINMNEEVNYDDVYSRLSVLREGGIKFLSHWKKVAGIG